MTTNTVNTNASATIKTFRDENYFLSNFYNCKVLYNGIVYQNAEAAFQAQKMDDEEYRIWMSSLNGADARKVGKDVQLVPDWDKKRIKVMHDVILAKFSNKELRQKLLATGDAVITHCNGWKDTFWGIYKGEGEDHLGKILMEVREEIKALKGFDKRAEAKAGVDNLIDTRIDENGNIVSEETRPHRFDRPEDVQNILRDEAGHELIRKENTWASSVRNSGIIAKDYEGIPSIGYHKVLLKCEPAVYVRDGVTKAIFTFVDVETRCYWRNSYKIDVAMALMDVISEKNGSMLGGVSYADAPKVLMAKPFKCWTLVNEYGNNCTYFAEEKFRYRVNIIQEREAEREIRELRAKERADNDARMAEEARMGREEKAPWED